MLIAQPVVVYCANSNALILNNLIVYNRCWGVYGGFGAGVALRNAEPILINNTISRNHSNQFAGGVFIAWSFPIITNTIIWNNEAVDEDNEIHIHECEPLITYCDIFAGFEGIGNINSNPEFRDVGDDDYRLMSTGYGYPYDSPCIDVGNPDITDKTLDSLWGLGTTLSDMGAYGGGDSTGTDIFEEIQNIPNKIALNQNFPNPFNPFTTIEFALDKPQHVSLIVYNLLGQEIAILIDGILETGSHSVTYDGSDLGSGIYYYTLKTDEGIETKSMVLLK